MNPANLSVAEVDALHELQRASDAMQPSEWQYASQKAGRPSLFFPGFRGDSPPCDLMGQMWIAPIDAVLDSKWLRFIKVSPSTMFMCWG